ncbi:a373e203-22aa-4f8e-a5a2-97250dee7a42 [Sclerotinia trifoliorum]|uniref:A373e203-22aa-4f8e-a5a2-97250dee7a42 n=1 Tax=Sclerotinia trifoliorum TaxID=28548 RepID=A0A8H2VVG6_9HELO|nr:a373e203-22aa-4f8e-a5a2-97250dee7a42 [Sclerotinia trifoliorum]
MNSSAPRDDWVVHGPEIAGGNLGSSIDTDNSRMSAGWKESSTPIAGIQGSTIREWKSPSHDRPFMWNMDYGSNGNQVASTYPHPDLSLPHPSLNLDFRMSVSLNPRISVGPTPFGHRNWISFTGGMWSGSWGSGTVLPGGQDSQLIIPDGSARLETNYLLQTHDDPPAYIAIKTHGWRTGPPEILAQLADPVLADQVDPNSYKFRIFIEMETGDERYSGKVNCGMWVGSGMRKGAEVVYDAYRVS